jgi:hypothetical protein
MEQRGGGKGAGRRSWNSFAAAVNNVSSPAVPPTWPDGRRRRAVGRPVCLLLRH